MKAQASLDSLLMIGLGLIMAAAFFFAANVMLSDSIASAQAEEAVERIAHEVSYVYASGEGTVRYADVTIPNGIEKINLDGNRVHFKVGLSSGSTDFYSNTPVKLVGSIPAEAGVERVTIRYLASGNVQVGDLKLTANPKSIHFYLERSGNGSNVVTVTNNANFTIDGIAATQEGLSDMVAITSPGSSLVPGASDTVGVTVSVPPNKQIGTYAGHIRVSSSNDGEDDVYVTISVQGGRPTNCTLSPGAVNLSIGQSQLFTASCVDAASESVPCPLLKWSTDAGNAIPIVSYSSSTLVVTDSDGSFVNANAGFSCSAGVSVPGKKGPLVTALFTTPSPIFAGDSIAINATGDCSGRGDRNISLCQVKIDSGPWQDMAAADGAYDGIVEDVHLSIGPKPGGQHKATAKCNDSAGNWGPESTLWFNVTAKPILFITVGNSASADEQYWLDWIDAHSSGEGHDWSYDTAQDSDVVNGSTNVSHYRIAMMAEYDTGAGIETELQDFQADGGVILMLGAALEDGPDSLGYSSGAGYSDGEEEVWIVNNTHYITSGFSTGRLTILDSPETNWRYAGNLGGIVLADGMKANKRQAGEPVLGDAGNLLIWGPTRPDNFNSNGDTITTRMIDHSLNSSTIG